MRSPGHAGPSSSAGGVLYNLCFMESLIKQILAELGEDPAREGLLNTPRRAEKALKFLTSGYHMNVDEVLNGALFSVEYSEMVIVKDIDFFSLCEHHLLPFFGKCHVAYIPRHKVIGLSKIPRLVDTFSRRLQIQERLTSQIAETIREKIGPLGVAVVMEATHLCMAMRGVEKQNPSAITSAMLGAFRDNARTRMEFLELIRRPGSMGVRSDLWPTASVRSGRVSVHILAIPFPALPAPRGWYTTLAPCSRRSPNRQPDACPRRPPPRAAALTCPSQLVSIQSGLMFCDVLDGPGPAQGVLVDLPPSRSAHASLRPSQPAYLFR